MSDIYDFVYKSSVEQIVGRIAELEAMLKRFEWGGCVGFCPFCSMKESEGHVENCRLAKLLKGGG